MKQRVLIILPTNTVGGAEKVIWSYFNNFKNSKISIKLLIVNATNHDINLRNKDIIYFNFSRFIFSVPKIINVINTYNINVVISTFPNISAMFLLLKYLNILSIKIIIRQPNVIEKSLNGNFKLFLLKNIYKFLIKTTDALIVTSQFMKQEVLKYKVSNEKIFLIGNPINVVKTRRGIRPLRIGENKIKLIFVGRLVYQKGVDRVLHLFKNTTNLNLIVVGDGKLKEKLIKKAKNLGVEKNIKFYGQKKNPFHLIAGSDYFLLPSRWEGLPNCVLESLALGTPVISTQDVPSLNDFKKNISNKSIILFKSIKEFSYKISKLKKRQDYRKPKLRNCLLVNYISPPKYNKKINDIILKIS